MNFTISSLFMDLTALLLGGKTVKTMAGLHTPQGCADFRNNSDATTKNSSRQKGDIQEVPHRGLEFLYVRKKNELE